MDWLEYIKNLIISGAVAENPAVMTASGWKQDKDGNWIQQPNKESKELANNLTKLGEAAITAPTVTGDIQGLYQLFRHPVKTGKEIGQTVKDIAWFVRHPKAVKVYHANDEGEIFDLKDAFTASPENIGVHVTPDVEITKQFGDNPISAWIPKSDTQTIDISFNNYQLLSDRFRYGGGQEDLVGNQDYLIKLLKTYKANPQIKDGLLESNIGTRIPLRRETFPKMNHRDQVRAERLFDQGEKYAAQEDWEGLERVNQEANDLLSRNNYKVIKYHNKSFEEVPMGHDGTCYIVTDPSVFFNPLSTFQQRMNFVDEAKYPAMYVVKND